MPNDLTAAVERLLYLARRYGVDCAAFKELKASILAAYEEQGWEMERLRELLMMKQPYSLYDVVSILTKATHHLLHEHDCDEEGHEVRRAAMMAGTGWLTLYDELLNQPDVLAARETKG